MPASLSSSRIVKIRRLAETLAYGAVGGVTFGSLGVPAGFLSGAMLFVACAALARRPVYMPSRLAQAILVLVGMSLGAVVTPETLHGVATYPVSIIVLIFAMMVMGFVGAAYLHFVHGWDRISAYLGAAPGGLSQVVAVASELGADVRGIAVVQSMRVIIIAVGLPSGLAAFGLVGPAFRNLGGQLSFSILDELAIVIVVSTATAILAHRIRFPGGLLFGSMIASAVLHGSGLIHAVMPWWVVNAAMIALGASVGSRFGGTTFRTLMDFVLAALGSFLVSVMIGALAAGALVLTTPLRIADVMIAFAPGSVDAMMLLALALSIDPVYVGSHHLTRIFFVMLTTPLIARYAARRMPAATQPKIKKPFQD